MHLPMVLSNIRTFNISFSAFSPKMTFTTSRQVGKISFFAIVCVVLFVQLRALLLDN